MYVIKKAELGYRIHPRGSKKPRFAICEAYQYSVVVPRRFNRVRDFAERNGYSLIVSKDGLPEGVTRPFSLLTRGGFGRVVVEEDVIIKVDNELQVISAKDFHEDWMIIPKVHEEFIDKLRGGIRDEENKEEN